MNQTTRSDPAIEQARKRIRQEEDRLCDLEDQLELADPLGASDIQTAINEQRDYLSGLTACLNRMLAKRGM
jgi:hypothetical protein